MQLEVVTTVRAETPVAGEPFWFFIPSQKIQNVEKHGIKELTGPTMTLGGWKPIESAATTSATVTTKKRTGSTT